MTDQEILQELRERFAERFSIAGRKAFRCVLVDPDEAARFFLDQMKKLQLGVDAPPPIG